MPDVLPALPFSCCRCWHHRHSRPFTPSVPGLQGFAEKLVTQLNVRYKRESWETRLAMMSLAARVVGVHKLVSLSAYEAAVLGLVPPATDWRASPAAAFFVNVQYDMCNFFGPMPLC